VVVQYFAYGSTAFVNRNLQPYDWYLNLVLAGAREHKLPQAYVDKIAAIQSIPDPWASRPNRLKALALLSRCSS